MRRRKVRFGMLRDGDIAEIWERWRAGEDQPSIAAALACSTGVVSDVIGRRGGVAPVAYAVPPWKRSPHRLRPTDENWYPASARYLLVEQPKLITGGK